MEIQPLELSGIVTGTPQIKTGSQTSLLSFKQMVGNYLEQVNDAQINADNKIQKFTLGEDIDLHEVMSAVAEAQITTQLTLQLKNKLVETYQEVMRMQV